MVCVKKSGRLYAFRFFLLFFFFLPLLNFSIFSDII